ncbi:MAG TPA: hypothetical protein VLX91_01015 [Candidatus Acidoferrales bacterium]|nr:hypothetical protein [Candidatus Acidoferrales bacterium]
MVKKIHLALLAAFLLSAGKIFAGPPFRTDDPVPVPYLHGELYLFSTGTLDARGTSGIGPAVEFNYGVFPNIQFHLVLPLSFNAPKGTAAQLGYGDTELGVKFRFVDQGEIIPDVATFPILELPTGSASRGLGNGKAQLYLPLWLQKDIGNWTIYGGAGYWINPGNGNRNWDFSGILVQYNFSDDFFLGAELFHQTPSSVYVSDNTGLHIGGGIPLVRNTQVLWSCDAGNGIAAYKHFSYYIGLYHTF